jgi:hypothetical protein
LNLIPFELHFGRKPYVSHLMRFSCKCFILKRSNLDKFESRSSDGILFGYTPHGRFYRVFNFETNIIIESYYVTFNETAPYPHEVFECACDKEIEVNIFVDEEHASMVMKMNHYFFLHHHPSLFLLSHLKQRLLRLLPLPQ